MGLCRLFSAPTETDYQADKNRQKYFKIELRPSFKMIG